MTSGEIIRKALLLIGVVDRNENPDASMYADGLVSLNNLLKRLGVDRHGVHTQAVVTHTLVINDGIYTIGPSGADISTARPHKITVATVTNGGIEYPLCELSRDEYRETSDKDLSGLPGYFFYEPTASNGTIYLYPYPDSTYTLNLTVVQALTEYTATNTTVSLPEEYLSHLPWGLAVDIAPEYQVVPSPVVIGRADETLTALKRLHCVPVSAVRTNPIGGQGDYDITSDIIRGY